MRASRTLLDALWHRASAWFALCGGVRSARPKLTALRWYIPLGDSPAVWDTGRSVMQVLDGIAQVDVSPTQHLYLGVSDVRFAHTVPSAAIGERAKQLEGDLADVKPLTLRVGEVGILPGAVVRWVEPVREIEDLQRVLGLELPQAPITGATSHGAPPHVVLAHVRQHLDLGALIAAVPSVTPAVVPVTHLMLVEVQRRNRLARWRVCTCVTVSLPLSLGSP